MPAFERHHVDCSAPLLSACNHIVEYSAILSGVMIEHHVSVVIMHWLWGLFHAGGVVQSEHPVKLIMCLYECQCGLKLLVMSQS